MLTIVIALVVLWSIGAVFALSLCRASGRGDRVQSIVDEPAAPAEPDTARAFVATA